MTCPYIRGDTTKWCSLAEESVDRLAGIVREIVEESSVDDVDPRLWYVVLRVDRETLQRARETVAAREQQ